MNLNYDCLPADDEYPAEYATIIAFNEHDTWTRNNLINALQSQEQQLSKKDINFEIVTNENKVCIKGCYTQLGICSFSVGTADLQPRKTPIRGASITMQ